MHVVYLSNVKLTIVLFMYIKYFEDMSHPHLEVKKYKQTNK